MRILWRNRNCEQQWLPSRALLSDEADEVGILSRCAFAKACGSISGPCRSWRRRVLLKRFLRAIDLSAAPALHCSRVEPPDPDQDVDGAHKVLGGKRRFRGFGDTISKWNAILLAHSGVELSVRCAARMGNMVAPNWTASRTSTGSAVEIISRAEPWSRAPRGVQARSLRLQITSSAKLHSSNFLLSSGLSLFRSTD